MDEIRSCLIHTKSNFPQEVHKWTYFIESVKSCLVSTQEVAFSKKLVPISWLV